MFRLQIKLIKFYLTILQHYPFTLICFISKGQSITKQMSVLWQSFTITTNQEAHTDKKE